MILERTPGHCYAHSLPTLLGGMLHDLQTASVVGRRRFFFSGRLVFSLGSALCGLAPTAYLLIAARVLQAVGGALLVPATLALLLPEFPPAKRAMVVGLYGAVAGVAAALGPS